MNERSIYLTMPKVTKEHLEARRQQIIDAACICFARKGFHPTTVQDICTEAALSPGAVYRYFESKEDIIIAACSAGQARDLIASVTATPDAPTADVMRGLVDAFILPLGAPEMRVQIIAMLQMWAEMAVNPTVRAMSSEGDQEAHDWFIAFVAAAQKRGEIAPGLSAIAVGDAMHALYHGLFMLIAADPARDVASYAEVVKALLTGSFWTGPNART